MFAGCSPGFYEHETIVFRVLTVKENRRIMDEYFHKRLESNGKFRIVLLENAREHY